MRAVGASVAIASAPCQGRFGMPHPGVLARAREAGLPVWWTGRDGAVLVSLGTRPAVGSVAEPRGYCGSAQAARPAGAMGSPGRGRGDYRYSESGARAR